MWSSSFLPGIYQGTHIRNQSIDPDRIIRDVTNRHLSRREQRSMLDLVQELNREHLQARSADLALEARIASMEMAFRMQFEAREAFDLANESKFTRQEYGDGEFANACLIARRLVERGVRVVQVYYGADQPWDDHQDINRHRDHARKSDRPIAALLKDLKARGLLEDTLVIWGGEFGRTPYSEGAKGRDHHSLGFSMWLAGGGVKGGFVHGATDELGMQAVDQPDARPRPARHDPALDGPGSRAPDLSLQRPRLPADRRQRPRRARDPRLIAQHGLQSDCGRLYTETVFD